MRLNVSNISEKMELYVQFNIPAEPKVCMIRVRWNNISLSGLFMKN